MTEPGQSDTGAPVTLGLSDLPDPGHWRVDVQVGFRGLQMVSTFVAQLLVKDSRNRWRTAGVAVMNDDGPIAAISDLLSALDMGGLPAFGRPGARR